jgi:hypothetical protein
MTRSESGVLVLTEAEKRRLWWRLQYLEWIQPLGTSLRRVWMRHIKPLYYSPRSHDIRVVLRTRPPGGSQ